MPYFGNLRFWGCGVTNLFSPLKLGRSFLRTHPLSTRSDRLRKIRGGGARDRGGDMEPLWAEQRAGLEEDGHLVGVEGADRDGWKSTKTLARFGIYTVSFTHFSTNKHANLNPAV